MSMRVCVSETGKERGRARKRARDTEGQKERERECVSELKAKIIRMGSGRSGQSFLHNLLPPDDPFGEVSCPPRDLCCLLAEQELSAARFPPSPEQFVGPLRLRQGRGGRRETLATNKERGLLAQKQRARHQACLQDASTTSRSALPHEAPERIQKGTSQGPRKHVMQT